MLMYGECLGTSVCLREFFPSLCISPDPIWILSFGHRVSAAVLTPGVYVCVCVYLVCLSV